MKIANVLKKTLNIVFWVLFYIEITHEHWAKKAQSYKAESKNFLDPAFAKPKSQYKARF